VYVGRAGNVGYSGGADDGGARVGTTPGIGTVHGDIVTGGVRICFGECVNGGADGVGVTIGALLVLADGVITAGDVAAFLTECVPSFGSAFDADRVPSTMNLSLVPISRRASRSSVSEPTVIMSPSRSVSQRRTPPVVSRRTEFATHTRE
jgi:hypothetical protein